LSGKKEKKKKKKKRKKKKKGKEGVRMDCALSLKSLEEFNPFTQSNAIITLVSLILALAFLSATTLYHAKDTRAKLAKMSALRDEERRGRILAQQTRRHAAQERAEIDGHLMTAIGHMSTPFSDRRGDFKFGEGELNK
jgi:predicted component of type VI protein secretion system